MTDFKKLEVWQRAHLLALTSHRIAIGIRGSRYRALQSQIIRAAMSIPANIVEGREARSEPEFGRFLHYALSSTSELEYHLIAAREIEVIDAEDYVAALTLVKQVRMMLFGLLKKLALPANRPGPKKKPMPG
jgi:four helix bundle protein